MDTDLSAASASFWGENGFDWSGFSVAGACDVNGDGYDDIVIGAFMSDDAGNDAGETYVVLGKASGWAMDTDLSAASASFWGEGMFDAAGRAVAGAGDLNGDGYDDILIGAPIVGSGKAFVVLGRASGWARDTDYSAAGASFLGEVAGDRAGNSVAGAGDVNGDGYDDILIGANNNDDGGASAGQTYLVMPSYSPPPPENLVAMVVPGGIDITLTWNRPTLASPSGYKVYRSSDGSNYVNLAWLPAAGSRMSYSDTEVIEGQVYCYYVAAIYGSMDLPARSVVVRVACERSAIISIAGLGMDTDLSNARSSFWGEDASDQSGRAVAGVGDVNGDGYCDFIIGAYGDDDGGSLAGQTYLVLGRASGWNADTDLSAVSASFWGEDAGDYSGYRVSAAGDVNADGFDDFLIGAQNDGDNGANAGQAYLILGKASGWAMDTDLSTASASFLGEAAQDSLGGSTAAAGDVNGDGYGDFLLAAGGNDEGGTGAGQVYLILGKASGWAMDTALSTASASFWGEDVGDGAGSSVAGVGDVNRDGFDDFVIGAYLDDDGGTSAGQTYLVLGKPSGWAMDTDLSTASASFWGEDSSDYSGYAVSEAGDVNGDGFDDFMIGAYNDEEGGSAAGQAYLVFGRAFGWAMDIDLSRSGASFTGETASDYAGFSVAAAGDLNCDGYDDILVGSYGSDEGGASAGQVYAVFGRPSGWSMEMQLAWAGFSLLGEDSNDFSGISVAGVGDIDGNGHVEFIIGAQGDDDGGSSSGQTYLIAVDPEPPAPGSLKATIAQAAAQVTLSWNAASAWVHPLDRYLVYRSVDGMTYKYLDFRTPSDRSYVDTNVTYGRTFYYKVVSSFNGFSDPSGTASVSVTVDRDTDLDGIGDMADWDDDGDGVVDGSDAFPLNSGETLDTDLDGTGNNADTDDDNDGILDTSDPEPRNPQNALQYHLNYLNTTLQSVQTTVNGFSSTLNTMNTNLNTLSSNVNTMQTSLTNLINNIDSDIVTLSAQVRGDIATMNSQVRADIATVRTGMDGMNASLRSNIDNVRVLVADVSSDLSAMDSAMKAMNRSIAQNISNMEARLALDIEALGVALEAVNASLQLELEALDGEIADFRSDLSAELNALKASMDAANRTQTENYGKVVALLNTINATSLADLKTSLAELDAETAQMGLNLNGRIDEFRTTTMGRLENISKVMATVDDIKSLSTEVKGVQGGVNAVKSEQETTSKNVAALAPPSWLAVVLIIVVLLLAAVILMKGGKKAEAAAPGAPPASPPPGTKPLEPLPPPED